MAIHDPYADWILSGAKTVETRYMRLSPKYMNKEIGIYVPERKKIVGVVRVVSQITTSARSMLIIQDIWSGKILHSIQSNQEKRSVSFSKEQEQSIPSRQKEDLTAPQ